MTDDYFWLWWEGPWSASDGFECNRKVTRLVNTNHQPATTEGLVDGVYCPHYEGSHSCVTEKTFWKYVVWTWKLLHQSKPVEETFVECCFFRLHFSVALMYYWRSKSQVNLFDSLVSLNTFQGLPKETVSHGSSTDADAFITINTDIQNCFDSAAFTVFPIHRLYLGGS